MTTEKRGRENLIHRWGTPAHPAVGTAPVLDFLNQEPPLPTAQRETPEAPITAQEPVVPVKHSRHHRKFNNGTNKKNRLEQEEHSRFLVYTIKQGLRNKQLNTSWDTAKHEVFNPSTQNFFPWAAFRGFKT